MRLRENVQSTAQREALGVTRATLRKADDSKKMQELHIDMMHSESRTEVEHWQSYGFSAVPLPPADGKEAEVLLAHVGGSRSHVVALGVADRRHRPKNLKPGESAIHDDQGQLVHVTRDGIRVNGGSKNLPVHVDVGGASMKVTKDSIVMKFGDCTLTIDGSGFHFAGGQVDHDGKKIDKTHRHTNSGGTGLGGVPE